MKALQGKETSKKYRENKNYIKDTEMGNYKTGNVSLMSWSRFPREKERALRISLRKKNADWRSSKSDMVPKAD